MPCDDGYQEILDCLGCNLTLGGIGSRFSREVKVAFIRTDSGNSLEVGLEVLTLV